METTRPLRDEEKPASSLGQGRLASEGDARQQVLDRALHSESFRRSQRLKDFLCFVGSRVLEGRSEEITEHSIGAAVFNRRKDFNPSEDNIVRATARSLRLKLRDYFEGEGAREPYRIEIPKGSYAPVFVRAEPKPVQPATQRWIAMPASIGLLAVALLSSAICLWLLVENRALRAGGGIPADERHLLSAIFGRDARLNVVLSDSLYNNLVEAQGFLTPLEEYSAGLFENPAKGPPLPVSADLWNLIRGNPYAHAEEARAAANISGSLGPGSDVKVHHARTVTMAQLQMGDNFLLLGGRRANPWTGLFEQDLNFQMEFPRIPGTAIFLNRNPMEGEREIYTNEVDTRNTGTTFARIVLGSGLSGSGKVILATGNTGNATAAAADLLMQPRMLEEVEQRLGRKVDSTLDRLEMIIESTVVGGRTRDFRIVAIR